MDYARIAPNKTIMLKNLDHYAIILSGICAVHCIALPLAISLLPFLSLSMHHGVDSHNLLFHQLIIFIIIPITLFALTSGYRSHKKWLPTLIASIGLIILLIPALFFDELIMHQLITHDDEVLITLIGGCIHAVGHILNVQNTRQIQHIHTNSL